MPATTPSGNVTIASGSSTNISINETYAAYQWSTGATTQSITVNSAGSYTCIVTNSNGCQGTTAPVVVTVSGNSLTATCTNDNSDLYFGYSGDQTSNITVTPSGGTGPYTVQLTMSRPLRCNQVTDAGDEVWTGGSGGTTINNACPVFPGLATLAPVSAKTISSGAYGVKVTLMDDADIIATVTDNNGATYSCATHIHGEDVRCFAGQSGNAKVTLCHKTGSAKNPCVKMCVDESDVSAHLAHGDFLGNCTANCQPPSILASQSSSVKSDLMEKSVVLRVYPNPTNGRFTVELQIPDKLNGKAEIQLMDVTGRRVLSDNAGMVNGWLQKQITPPSTLASEAYIVSVIMNNRTYKAKLIYAQ